MNLFKNQKGFNDTITVAIIGGIVGAIFIGGVFVWQEVESFNQIKSFLSGFKDNTEDSCCCKYLTDDIINEDLLSVKECQSRKGECIKVDPGRLTPHPCCPNAVGPTCGSEDVDGLNKISLRYFEDNGEIFYTFLDGPHKVEGADLETFEVLYDPPIERVNSVAKDKNAIYFNFSRTTNVDLETFEAIGFGYAKDKENVYISTGIVEGVDVATFEHLNRYYKKDKNRVYYNTTPTTVDIESYELVGEFYIKDRKNVYYNGSLLLYSDPETFEVLENSYYAKDANKVYAFGKVLEGVNPDEFDLEEYLER